MSDELVKRLRGWARDIQAGSAAYWTMDQDLKEAADRIEAMTADFARQVQRTDEQREAYEQALSVMEAERDRLRHAIRFWLEAQEPDVDAAINMMRAALKGETP